MFDRAAELQLDCRVEKSSRGTTMKHESLLSLAEHSQHDDFSASPQNGPPYSETTSSPLPVDPNDIKHDRAAGDTSANIGESESLA